MADLFIENGYIKAGFNFHGAELVSLINKADNTELMWSGDAKYWGRVSPVLFPFVGKLNNKAYRYQGKEYTDIPQHGFARDCEFKVSENKKDEVWFELIPSDEMKAKYPFNYSLHIGYKLEENNLRVKWKLQNRDSREMYFSIGAHPAFMCPDMDNGKKYYLDFNKKIDELESGIINTDGVLGSRTKQVKFENRLLELSQELFAEDALIFDAKNISEVSLIDNEKKKILSVKFDVPQLGIWSPAGKNAPFVCIEPWYGRCDREGFEGELKDREFGNTLKGFEVFEREYSICVE